MNQMDSDDVVKMLHSIAKAMKDNRTHLIELDSVVGDGDLGITMEKGFHAAEVSADENKAMDPGIILMKAGMEIAKAAPSTMGTLMATGLMRGGKAIKGKASLDVADLTAYFEGFLQGVTERGKAKAGDKTILDVLIPAVEEMRNYKGDSLVGVMACALNGAEKGLMAERTMMSQHGKAAVFREKTIGVSDPGSEAVYIMLKACAESMQK